MENDKFRTIDKVLVKNFLWYHSIQACSKTDFQPGEGINGGTPCQIGEYTKKVCVAGTPFSEP
jgi:hypothetical protein